MPPKRSKEDIAHMLARAAISAVPYVGGPAKELFNFVITPPLEKRLAKWMNEMADRITEIEENAKGFKKENLKENQMFLTAVMHATSIALRNHQKEKLEALQNAVVNTARGIDLQEDLQLLFLNLVDSFTTLHLRILKFLDAPELPANEETVLQLKRPEETSLGDLLEMTLPELKGQSDVYNAIVQDLFNRGLLSIGSSGLLPGMTSPTWGETWTEKAFVSRTTDLGKRFLKYITS